MKLAKRLAISLLVATVGLAGLYLAMAERVEVVVVHTRDDAGDHATRVWIVDDAGAAWLRTGADNASWLPRLRANPAVELERGGATRTFTATVLDDAAAVARVDELSLAKYGWSEQLLRAVSGEGHRQVAIRLDPQSPP